VAKREKAYLVSAEDVVNLAECSADFLLTAIEASYDGIYITDGNANTIMINRSYEVISGLRRGDLLGRNMRELEEQGVISQSGTLRALETGMSVTMEQSFRTGKRVLITSTPIFSESGEVAMVLTNVRDVTEMRELEERLELSQEQNRLYNRELENLREQTGQSKSLVATDPAMQEVLRMALRVAKLDAPVLLQGEGGTGKSQLARYIVGKSRRKKERYIEVNCADDQETLEKKLFGCAPGVDPNFPNGNKGFLELAEGGTILLDEISELSANLQRRIYQYLYRQEFERVGSADAIQGDVRILATTRCDLKELVGKNLFREDLFYLLDVLSIQTLPLRERREDILPIVQDLVVMMNKKYHQKKRFTPEALRRLRDYRWPGNIQELRNTVERVMVMCPDDLVSENDLPIENYGAEAEDLPCDNGFDLQRKLDEVEYLYLQQAYQRHGNVRAAAKSLQMDPSTFARRKRKLSEKLSQK